MRRVMSGLGWWLVVGAVALVSSVRADEGLVAHYDCDAGEGGVLHDRSGNGLNGTIHGAKRVKLDEGGALKFGEGGDFVDMGDPRELRMTDKVTLAAWVLADRIPKGEARVVGKDYGSYVLTYYVSGQIYWYIKAGGNNCRVGLSPGFWHHVAGTFDGKTMKLYLDGELRDQRESKVAATGPGKDFRLGVGKKDMGKEFAADAYFTTRFEGMIDEVRVYRRALSAEEVAKQYRQSIPVKGLVVSCDAYTYAGDVGIHMDLKGLGRLPDGAAADMSLSKPGQAALQSVRIQPLHSWGRAKAMLHVGALAPGRYQIEGAVRGPDGKTIGEPVTIDLDWPELPKPKPPKVGRRINNLVTELLNVPAGAGGKDHSFTNGRDGYVLVAASGPGKATISPKQGESREAALVKSPSGTFEAMCFLTAGAYRIVPTTNELTVCAIPELIYCKFAGNPQVTAYGPFDLAFMQKHVLSSMNCLVVGNPDAHREFFEGWKKQGKRAIEEVYAAPYFKKQTADEALGYWSKTLGMAHPLLDGIIVDEFSASEDPVYPALVESIERLLADERFAGRTYYPYCGSMYGAKMSEDFVKAVIDQGSKFAIERYLPEQPTIGQARRFLDRALVQDAAGWAKHIPGSVEHMIVCFGHYISAPPESVNTNPSVDQKVYMDMQFNILANHANFAGVYGIMEYTAGYADEECVRWSARLYRHYGIEGGTEMLSDKLGYKYILDHVRNPDFDADTDGWEIKPAEPGSVTVDHFGGYSFLEGRYPKTTQGDTFLRMKRSAKAPNAFSQTIRGLTPGKLYSLKMFTGDHKELVAGKSEKSEHAISIAIENVELVADKCFRHVFDNCYSHQVGKFDNKNKYWMNLHQRLFRPKAQTAKLTVSDWPTKEGPGGPVGRELMYNFVEVQPYFD